MADPPRNEKWLAAIIRRATASSHSSKKQDLTLCSPTLMFVLLQLSGTLS